jgi:hypothetical protein
MQKRDLSPSHQRLIRECQRINFGRLERLHVRDGRPVFDPPPKVVREVKFGGENGPRPEIGSSDFELKSQARELIAQLEALGDGIVSSIEIKHGLPFRMTVEEVCA